MAVLPLRRISVLGPLGERRTALASLQELGCVHLISTAAAHDADKPSADEGRDAREALRFLEDCADRRHQVGQDVGFDMPAIVSRALEVKRALRELGDRREFLVMRSGLLSQWGNFRLAPIEHTDGYRLWFYVVPLYQMDAVRESELVWQEIDRDNRQAFVVVVSRDEPEVAAMPVPRTHTGSVSLADLREELQRIELEMEDLVAERASLTRWIGRLRDNLDAADDRASLARAIDTTWSEQHLFVIQGWAPADAIDDVRTYADAGGFALLDRPPTAHEAPPTLLDNREQLAGGQAIVSFWQLPGYHDFDPSSIVAVSFALFFAMIMSDAGYALVLAVLLGLLWRRLGVVHGGGKIRDLGLMIVGMSLGYGALAGSYFGVTPTPGSFAAKLQVLDVQDYASMMRLAIIIGAGHLIIGNAMAAWRGRGRHVALGQMGWALAIAGGLLLWLGWERNPQGFLALSGMAGLAAGLLCVFAFSGEQRVTRARDLVKRLGQGGLALTSVTKAFGDVLSYLRLFALGLASASLAMTFNQLAGQVHDATGAAGPYLAGLLLLVGHTLNFALILMSAVVHGLRLNLIEFFNWSVTEEGYPFNAFRKRSRQ